MASRIDFPDNLRRRGPAYQLDILPIRQRDEMLRAGRYHNAGGSIQKQFADLASLRFRHRPQLPFPLQGFRFPDVAG